MNIAEILKNCPKWTNLYSPILGEVKLFSVDKNSITCITSYGFEEYFQSDGKYMAKYTDAECTLFPSKDQRDWNKFRLPVKRGDIMMETDGTVPFIASGEYYQNTSPKYICGVDNMGNFNIGTYGWTSEFYIPASEEAKKKLFDKMAEAGYKWNAKTLELEKIKKPKFKPFDKVLVRGDDLDFWTCSFFSHISSEYDAYPYHCVNGAVHAQCIPYEGNEHLLGTRKKE